MQGSTQHAIDSSDSFVSAEWVKICLTSLPFSLAVFLLALLGVSFESVRSLQVVLTPSRAGEDISVNLTPLSRDASSHLIPVRAACFVRCKVSVLILAQKPMNCQRYDLKARERVKGRGAHL